MSEREHIDEFLLGEIPNLKEEGKRPNETGNVARNQNNTEDLRSGTSVDSYDLLEDEGNNDSLYFDSSHETLSSIDNTY